MSAFQPAPWMIVEHLENIGLVVLAAEHDEDAASGEMQQAGVEVIERLAWIFIAIELDTIQSLLADNAAPERVIAIEDQAFLCPAFERSHDAGDILGVQIEEFLSERRLEKVAATLIEGPFHTQETQVAVPIGEAKTRRVLPYEVDNEVVQLGDLRGRIRSVRREHQSKLGIKRGEEGIDDNGRASPRLQQLEKILELG